MEVCVLRNKSNISNYNEFMTSVNLSASSVINLTFNEIIFFLVFASVCIVTTIFGNVLVTLSVFTYGPLKSVQNFFIVSLAGADLAVAVLVMPFNAASFVSKDGDWQFGSVWCNVWLTLDILCCTASILHLCAIAIDRYYAIHDPINYAVQRTYRRVLVKIAVVWMASAVISIPPLIGWNNSSSQSLYDDITRTCRLTDETSFVIYSAAGSFYIPLLIMSFVYAQIYRATRARLRSRVNESSKKMRAMVPSGLVSTVAITPGLISDDASAWVNDALRERQTCGEVKSTVECDGQSSYKCCVIEVGLPAQVSVQQYLHPTMYNVKKGEAVNCGITRLPSSSSIKTCTSPTADCTLQISTKELLSVAPETKIASPSSDVPQTRVNQRMNTLVRSKQGISLTKERRAARTMGIIMGAFVVCWLPFFLMYVILAFCESCAARADIRFVNFIVWLGYVNSALNPIIYTIFNIDFRRAIQNLIFGRWRIVTN